jgi:DNA-binding XRE family transcriptional regulator
MDYTTMQLVTIDEVLEDNRAGSEMTSAEIFQIGVEAKVQAMLFGLGFAMKNARKYQGITQQVLSEMTGIPQSELSRLERGKANPTLETLARLYVALGIRHRVFYKDYEGEKAAPMDGQG